MTNNPTDLESLISSTLDAIEISEKGIEKCMEPPSYEASGENEESLDTSESTVPASTDDDVDVLLSRLQEAAPKAKICPSGITNDPKDLDQLLDDLLTPDSIVDSMESLASELEAYLKDKDLTSGENERYHKQLLVNKDVSIAYKLNSNILEEQSAEGERIRGRLAELQTLGNPPQEVVEKLMMSQLPTGEADGDIAKEFESFLKEAGEGGLLPGLSKEDEEMLKKLTQDPNALKNLLVGDKPGAPGDCTVM